MKGTSRHASLDTLMIYHETDQIDDPVEQYIRESEDIII